MTALRSDAARSRERILTVARDCDLRSLRLNDIARAAGVGVGTVYRHFPTVHALVEALSIETMRRMRAPLQRAVDDPDPRSALAGLLRATLMLQLEDSGLQQVLVSSTDESDEARALKRELIDGSAAVLERARSAEVVKPEITIAQLQHLVCGIEHAVRLGTPDDADALLEIVVDGLAPNPRNG